MKRPNDAALIGPTAAQALLDTSRGYRVDVTLTGVEVGLPDGWVLFGEAAGGSDPVYRIQYWIGKVIEERPGPDETPFELPEGWIDCSGCGAARPEECRCRASV